MQSIINTQIAHKKEYQELNSFSIQSSFKILVVEDNPVIQFVVSSMLEELGYRFDIAKDGQTAIEFAHTNNYSLILMDIDLPDISGIQVAEQLFSSKSTRGIPIVAMTSHTEQEYIERCYAAHMVGFYNKPRTKEDINNMVNTHTRIQ